MIDIASTMSDPAMFQPWFEGESWGPWHVVLKAAKALPLTAEEIVFFRTVADRDPPTKPVRELWIVAGRRSGKDSIASAIAAHTAAFFEHSDRLRPGERALVMCLACDRDQAKIVLNYTRSYFRNIPMLAEMVRRETATGFELDNGVDIAVATNSFRQVRGRAVLCAIFDEVAYWRDETSASPDKETYQAIKPGLATLPGAMLIGISSPYRRAGLLHEKWRKHYGQDGDVLVIRAPSIVLNPTLDKGIIAQAFVEDPAAAAAEWNAEWRSDIAGWLDINTIESAVDRDVTVRPPAGHAYHSFCDPSSGARDSFTCAIAHDEGGVAVLDCVVEIKAPFNPTSATEQIAATLQAYGLSATVGDKYAAGFVVDAMAKCGIEYRHSERDRSALYLDALPLFTTGRVRLLDNRRLVTQFASLERRTSPIGKDRVDHGPSGADDLCNSVAGVLCLTAHPPTTREFLWTGGSPGGGFGASLDYQRRLERAIILGDPNLLHE